MRIILWCALPLFVVGAQAKQQELSTFKSDSAYADNRFMQDAIVVEGSLLYQANLRSPLQQEILKLENQEAEAQKNTDTTVLKKIWIRDFSLDNRSNKMLGATSALPIYVYFTRHVQSIIIADKLVFSSGVERVSEVDPFKKYTGTVQRKFSHVWEKKLGAWKLISKTITTQ